MDQHYVLHIKSIFCVLIVHYIVAFEMNRKTIVANSLWSSRMRQYYFYMWEMNQMDPEISPIGNSITIR